MTATPPRTHAALRGGLPAGSTRQHRFLGQPLRLGAVHRPGVGGDGGGAEERVAVQALHHADPVLLEVLRELGARLREPELNRGTQGLGVARHRPEQLVGGGETAGESQPGAYQGVLGGGPRGVGVQLVGGDAVASLGGERRDQAHPQRPGHPEPAVECGTSIVDALHLLEHGGHATRAARARWRRRTPRTTPPR